MLMLRKPHISAEQLRAIEPPTLVPAGSKDLVAELILEFCPGEARPKTAHPCPYGVVHKTVKYAKGVTSGVTPFAIRGQPKSSARNAAPYSECGNTKRPGHLKVPGAFCLAERA